MLVKGKKKEQNKEAEKIYCIVIEMRETSERIFEKLKSFVKMIK